MKKRILPTLLALTLTISLLPSALAAPAAITDMAQVLSALDIMTGNENGDLMLSRRVSRAEFTKLIVAASPMGENVGASTTVSPYPDVPYSHWAAPHVEAAVAAGYVNGYLDGTFHPDEDITLAMAAGLHRRRLLRRLALRPDDPLPEPKPGRGHFYRSGQLYDTAGRHVPFL